MGAGTPGGGGGPGGDGGGLMQPSHVGFFSLDSAEIRSGVQSLQLKSEHM